MLLLIDVLRETRGIRIATSALSGKAFEHSESRALQNRPLPSGASGDTLLGGIAGASMTEESSAMSATDSPFDHQPPTPEVHAPVTRTVRKLTSSRPKLKSPGNPYGELLNGLYDAVLIVKLDGTVVDGNRRARQFLGYTSEELSARNIADLFSGFDESLLVRIHAHLANGRFTVLDAYCVRKDGTSFPTETAVGRIQLSNEGELVFSVRNIERRRATQERLRTADQALQSSASGVAVADMKGRLTYVNPAFLILWGYQRAEDVEGTDIREFWEDSNEAQLLVSEPLASNTWSGELMAKNVYDEVFHVQVTAAPNRDTKDRLVGIVYSFIDITDRRRAEEAIQKEAESQLAKAREQKAFSGLLSIVPLSDVVQLIEATHKTGQLTVTTSSNEKASVWFKEGQIIDAVCGGVVGEEAFCALIHDGGEDFHFEPCDVSLATVRIKRTTLGLLLDAARQSDEARHGRAHHQ
jgi:PAS domain S-box-containing protein